MRDSGNTPDGLRIRLAEAVSISGESVDARRGGERLIALAQDDSLAFEHHERAVNALVSLLKTNLAPAAAPILIDNLLNPSSRHHFWLAWRIIREAEKEATSPWSAVFLSAIVFADHENDQRLRLWSGQVLSNHAEPSLRVLGLRTLWELAQNKESHSWIYAARWLVGVSSQGHIVQSVKDRPRPKDSGLVAGEAPWRESKTAEPSDNMLGKECAQRTRLQRAVNADVASLHESPVAETVYNARKQQGRAETSPIRQPSPAGYQRRHGVKDDVETGEALGARRRKLVEEMPVVTVSGKCGHRHQGGGSGRTTVDGRAAKRVRREGPGPVSIPPVKARQG
jgi:hypothetical protein